MDTKAYGRLVIMALLSFLSMYVLMYAMVNSVGNILPNLNQLYMAGLMTSPMVMLEIYLMGDMYRRKRWNALILGVSVIAMVGFFGSIRRQAAISDEQFLKSMIPHHAGAILMCEEASLQDPAVRALCLRIRSSQQSEIAEMREMLRARKPGRR